MTTFLTLFSGSSGNSAWLGTDQGAILIDCGMSGKQTLDAICTAGLDPADLTAILISHEHSDHVKGAGILSRKLDIPIYATEGTWSGMEACVGAIPAHVPARRIQFRSQFQRHRAFCQTPWEVKQT